MRRLCLLAGCGDFCARRTISIMGHAMASCEICSHDTARLARTIVRTSEWSKSGRPIAPDRKRSAAHHHQQQPRTSFKARPAPKFVASAAQAAHFGSQNLLAVRCDLALECLLAVRVVIVAVVACFLLLRALIGVCTCMLSNMCTGWAVCGLVVGVGVCCLHGCALASVAPAVVEATAEGERAAASMAAAERCAAAAGRAGR
jgi:hypothetical protein